MKFTESEMLELNGEKWGRGLRFILEKEKETTFKDVAEIFTTTFKRKYLTEKSDQKSDQKIIELISQNTMITI